MLNLTFLYWVWPNFLCGCLYAFFLSVCSTKFDLIFSLCCLHLYAVSITDFIFNCVRVCCHNMLCYISMLYHCFLYTNVIFTFNCVRVCFHSVLCDMSMLYFYAFSILTWSLHLTVSGYAVTICSVISLCCLITALCRGLWPVLSFTKDIFLSSCSWTVVRSPWCNAWIRLVILDWKTHI